MVESFLDWIKEKLKGEKKGYKRTYYRLPADPKIVARYIDEATQKLLAEVEAERDKLVQEVERLKSLLKKEEQRKREEQALLARQAEIEIKEMKRKNTKIFLFANRKLPKVISAYDGDMFTDDKGNPMPFLEGFGFRLENTGDTTFFLILSNGKKRGELTVGTVNILPYLLDWNNIVKNLKLGVIPIYVTKDGELIPRHMECSLDEIEHLKNNVRPEIARLLKIDLEKLKDVDPEIKAAFFALYSRLNRLYSELLSAKEQAKMAEWEHLTTELERAVQAKEAEILRTDLQVAINNLLEQYRNMAPMLIESQQAHLKAAGLEQLLQTMYHTQISLMERIKTMAEDPRKVAKFDIMQDLEMLSRFVKTKLKTEEEKT